MRQFISKFVAKKSPTQLTPARSAKKLPRTCLGIQMLERRDVPSAQLDGFTLNVGGTGGNDVIEMRTRTQNSIVFTQVLVNGVSEFDAAATINRINIDGLAGSDQVFIHALQPNVTEHANVVNSEEVTVGEPNAAGLFSLDNVRSRITAVMPVDGRLSVRGDAATTPKTINVGESQLNGLSPFNIRYEFTGGAFSRLSLSSGSGADTVNVNGTPALGVFGVIVNTNGGADTFNVAANTSILRLNGGDQDDTFNLAPASGNLRTLDRTIIISGGGGSNAMVISDQNRNIGGQIYEATFAVAPQGGTFNVTEVNIANGAENGVGVGFSGVQSVSFAAPVGGGGANRIRVEGTQAGVSTVINAGGSNDIRVGAAGSLNDIQGALTVNRATVGGVLVLDDSAQTNVKSYTLGANSVDRTNMAEVSFDNNVGEVQVLAGSANDSFFANLRAAGTYRLNGGGGVDEVRSPGSTNLWDVTENNGGVLNTRIFFSNAENLQGGSGDDHFRLSNGRGVTGFLNADPVVNGNPIPSGGFDTIDYSAYTSVVGVNLADRRATNVGGAAVGRLTGFNAILGGQAGDALTGDGGANVILGGHGNDVILGGGGRDILFGGDGADDLSNRTGDPGTIYVGGITANSLNIPSAMKALRAEWTRTDNTDAQKKANIITGGGLTNGNSLNGTTIANDSDVDIIRAGNGFDVIYLHGGDLLDGNQPADQVVNL